MKENMNLAWFMAASNLFRHGSEVSPRGFLTEEVPQHTMEVDMMFPIMTIKGRKLNYRFMAAEAYWILSGMNTVADIVPYNSQLLKFSDDGKIFAGAYGPEVVNQLGYVVNALIRDRDTRQAVMTIWKKNPEPSKDIPCTVAFSFMIRDGKLNCHAFMRSNDLWLGTPYDVFNFSMLSTLICAMLNRDCMLAEKPDPTQIVAPGTLFLTAASLHVYQPHWESVLNLDISDSYELDPLPSGFYLGTNSEDYLMNTLKDMREKGSENLRWWK